MRVTTLGIDLAKNVFRVHGCDASGKVAVSKSLTRRQLQIFVATLPPCLVGMEACATAHYWAREIQKHGHEVRLMAPQYVRPYVKTNKNDTRDAEAICEAVRRPTMRFVAVKSTAQQDVQALHRVRQQLVKEMTALCNQVRGLLAEYGVVIPRGIAALRPALSKIVAEQDNGLSGLMRELVLDLSERLHSTQQRVRRYNQRIVQLLHQDERCQRLAALPGVGPLTATAVVAAVGNARDFKSGRELAAYLGLVPRHRASGGRTIMLGISKRGDCYLRTLMVHGARAAMRNLERRRDPRSVWAGRLKLRRGANIATVALANKNARVIWALLTRGEKYCATPHPAPMPQRA
jgi:transposase